jgi:hypothetical protein
MSPRQLRRLASQTPVQARVISDGSRDYLVEIVTERGASLLRGAPGRGRRFRSLGEVHGVLRRCGIDQAVLRHRVAQDETSGPMLREACHDQPLAVAEG